jgi:hypothetical protein
MSTDPTPQTTPPAATSEIIMTGLSGPIRHTTGPHAWRLARKDGELILQGLMRWREGRDGGEYWETIPTIDLTDEESES